MQGGREVTGSLAASNPARVGSTPAVPASVRGRSCLEYGIVAHDIDLAKPIVLLGIDHTRREVHIGEAK